MNQSNSHIEECLQLIETKWHRGRREDWSSYDFEKLNTSIFDATGVSLSVSTLKRLFGKVSYPNLPSVHTLNTLARFAGFEDWGDFRQRSALSSPIDASSKPTPDITPHSPIAPLSAPTSPIAAPSVSTGRPRHKPHITRWWPVLLVPIVILFYSLLSSRTPHALPDNSQYVFTANKVISEGVPNSVIFHYKTPVTPADSVFIVQSWDMRRRIAVPPNGTDYSAIYYYPGYFNAKLIVDTQIVRTHDLMITSNGWLGLAESDPAPVSAPTPVYFKQEEITHKEAIEVDSATLSNYHLTLEPAAPKVRLFYMKDFGHLSDEDFTFETTLKTAPPKGSGVCQNVQVLIQCKNDVFIIPLAAKACIGDLSLYAAGASASSRNADLSGFGCDLSQWTTLRVTSAHRNLTFYVNGKPAWSGTFHDNPEDIVGVQYRFNGTCAVKNARFTTAAGAIDLK